MKLKNIHTKVNTSTGEVVEYQKTFSIKTPTEHFYITYINSVSERLKITRMADRNILELMCCKANYDTGIVVISKKEKLLMCEQIGIKVQSYYNSIKRLLQLGLISGEYGTYTISPLVFWKGSEDERNKLIKKNKLSYTVSFEPTMTGGDD